MEDREIMVPAATALVAVRVLLEKIEDAEARRLLEEAEKELMGAGSAQISVPFAWFEMTAGLRRPPEA